MALTTTEIEASIIAQCSATFDEHGMFFKHDTRADIGEFLWYDNNDSTWNINTYSVVHGEVIMGAMPIKTFSKTE